MRISPRTEATLVTSAVGMNAATMLAKRGQRAHQSGSTRGEKRDEPQCERGPAVNRDRGHIVDVDDDLEQGRDQRPSVRGTISDVLTCRQTRSTGWSVGESVAIGSRLAIMAN